MKPLPISQLDAILSGAVFLLSLSISWIVTPVVIQGVNYFKLLDTPDQRKEHKIPTPTMGGISFTIVFLCFTALWKEALPAQQFWTIALCVLILFAIGLLDDTKGVSASKKLLIEMVLGGLLIHSGCGIKDLHGIMGIHHLGVWQQYAFNIVLMAGLINAFNLIDGINGLAGGIGLINSIVFTVIFFLQHNTSLALLSLSFSGALFGFLRYNFGKAKIFMGDTGSLHLGLMMAIFGIQVVNGPDLHFVVSTNPIFIVCAIWLIPVFDTLRVFAVRIGKGKSPFSADRRHVHHLLIKSGLNHPKAAISIYMANIVLIVSISVLPPVNPTFHFLLMFLEAIVLIELLTVSRLLAFYRKSKAAFTKTSQIIYGQLYLNK